jgi:hypothetical protein
MSNLAAKVNALWTAFAAATTDAERAGIKAELASLSNKTRPAKDSFGWDEPRFRVRPGSRYDY